METGSLGIAARAGRGLGLAVGFLTILPVPAAAADDAQEVGRAAVWFPVVGLALGGALWAVYAAASFLFPPFLAGVLVVAAWAALTGALHLDGLADCCDGLLAPVAQERRLEILRDPRVGAFGAVGLVLFLAAKIGAVAALPNAWPALLLAPALARWLLLWAARSRPAWPGGMGAAFGRSLTPRLVWPGGIAPLLLLIGGFSWHMLMAAAAAALVAWGVVIFARKRIGGVTGDVLGLAVELCELVVLLPFAAASQAGIG